MPVSSKYNKHWPTCSVDCWVLHHNGHKNCLQLPSSLKGAHPQTCSYLDPAPQVRTCVASTRILSGFSSFEMWSYRRASREHRQARRSSVCWRPDKDLTPTGSRRTSGPGAGCARSWPHCAGVGRTRGLRKEAEPRASLSTPQGQQVPRGNNRPNLTGSPGQKPHKLVPLSSRQDPESHEGSASRWQLSFFARH